MNICIISGIIASDLDIEFAVKFNKCIAILNCELLIENRINIKIRVYNEKALEIYENCKKGDFIEVKGEICSEYISVEEMNYIILT